MSATGILNKKWEFLLKILKLTLRVPPYLHYSPRTACKIINACAVLHNICIENNIPFPQYDDWQNDMFNQYIDDNNEEIANKIDPELVANRQLWSRLIYIYFRLHMHTHTHTHTHTPTHTHYIYRALFITK